MTYEQMIAADRVRYRNWIAIVEEHLERLEIETMPHSIRIYDFSPIGWYATCASVDAELTDEPKYCSYIVVCNRKGIQVYLDFFKGFQPNGAAICDLVSMELLKG